MLTGAVVRCNRPDIEFEIGEPGMLTGAVAFWSRPDCAIPADIELSSEY